MELKKLILHCIDDEMAKVEAPYQYRTPLVGFADAHDGLYDQLSEIIGNHILKPTDIMPEAKTVIVFFIPFVKEMGEKIQKNNDVYISHEWSDYYLRTNVLLSAISERLTKELEGLGIKVTGEPPTDNYDPVNLTAKWGHKSSAVISGIATFGLNRLLVTKYGTMGRISSLIIDRTVEPTERTGSQQCLYYKNGSCHVCVDRCPVGALSEKGIDRFRCNAYLAGKNVSAAGQGCPACSSGPCAVRGFAD